MLKHETMLKGRESWTQGVAFIPGSHLLVTCSGDNNLQVWGADTGQ
jgi:WD40 repeat protein